MNNKVVHLITGLNDGGAEAVLTRLCLNSSKADHVVISLMDEGKYGPVLRAAGIKVYCLGMRSGKPSLILFWRLIRFIRLETPCVVQTWMYHADFFGGIAAKVAGVDKVFWGIRHSTLEKGTAKKSTIFIAKLCAFLSRSVPEKIVCCAQKALVVHRDLGYENEKLLVIPNGYNLSTFKPDRASGDVLRGELGVSPGIFLIGMVGRYDPIKDYDNLLRAAAELWTSGLELKCLLVGKGLSNDNHSLMARIKELRLENQVILAGQRTDIPEVMNALDLHVLSSSSEGFPNVIAEAMACGTPAVSTDVGDAGQIVGDHRLLCTPQDSRALAKLITTMHLEWQEKPEAWKMRSMGCAQHIQHNFSIERMVAAYESCWFNDSNGV